MSALAALAATAALALPGAAPLGTSTGCCGTTLARLDPLTLRPRGTQIRFGEFHDHYSFAPGRRLAAFSISAPGRHHRIGAEIVDVRGMKVVRDLELGGYGGSVGWLTPRRLVVGGRLVDPLSGRTVRRVRYPLRTTCSVDPPQFKARGKLLMLLRGHVATVDRRGRMRLARLRGLPLQDCLISPSHGNRPDLAVDRGGRRALVVGEGPTVFAVDLRSMRASALPVGGPRLRGAYRTRARALGHGLLAAAHVTRTYRARGVELIDLRRPARRMLAPRAGGVAVTAGRVLAFNGGYAGFRRGRAIGLTAFDRRGRRRFHVLGRRRVWDVQTAGRFAYAFGPRGVAVVDVATGRVVHRSPGLQDQEVMLLSARR